MAGATVSDQLRSRKTSLIRRTGGLPAGGIPSLPEGIAPAMKSGTAYPVETIQDQRKRSASFRNPVRLQPGIVFGIPPECCSASFRNLVALLRIPRGPECDLDSQSTSMLGETRTFQTSV
jgi:hypothetical protein